MSNNERKTWIMYKKAIKPLPEYIPGMKAHWSGLDEPVNNSWIDRVNGYKFTPTIASEFIYDPQNKLYHNTTFRSCMNSNFAPGNGVYTLEIVMRNIKGIVGNYTRAGESYYTNSGFVLSPSGYHGPHIHRVYWGGKYIIKEEYRESSGSTYGQYIEKYVADTGDNELYTYTYGPGIGALNGVVKTTTGAGKSTVTGTLVLGQYGSQSDRAVKNLKVHAIRWYPFKLTAEQVAHNYECDKQWYKLEGDEK